MNKDTIMFRRCHSHPREQGSLPLALLVAIIVGGIIVVLVARTLTAQNQVQFDQTYHGALPAADAGVQLAQHRLNETGTLFRAEDGTDYSRQEFPVGERTQEQTGVLDGREFTWTMERVNDLVWEVDSESIDPRTDVGRRVNVQFRDQPLLAIAAFTENLFAMTGSNTADSYNSLTGAPCTGEGIVASNNDVVFSGSASGICQGPQRTVDRVHLYDWEDNPGANATETNPGGMRCRQGTNNMNHNNCIESGGQPAPLTIDERREFATDEAIAFIEDALNACGTLEDYSSSSNGTELTPALNAQQAIAQEDFALAGGHYCYDNLDFDLDTTLHSSATRTNPVIIFVQNEVTLRRGTGQPRVDVACVGCNPESQPVAGRLWIFVLNGNVLLSNQSNFAGVMWAPRATCMGHPSNAQVDIFGSVICDNITNAGGWRYHYDESLNEVTSGEHVPIGWSELPTVNS